eukprot:TRINITY_DN4327_c0_g2_i1.p1 TRINITY_DN4327_c0_g2~~TRINITY_DN4327_c0_g2_i1.p1  ORF type:complete len:457 (-),score=85.42 TRINITY_DN4327_c0_g2_i1:48-1418(-)
MSRGQLESCHSFGNLKSYSASAFPGIPVHASSAELLNPKEQLKKKAASKNLTLNPFKRTLRTTKASDKDDQQLITIPKQQREEEEVDEGPQIKFATGNSTKIVAISLNKIIELLTPETGPIDANLRSIFFLTYHSVVSPVLILEKIVKRFHCAWLDTYLPPKEQIDNNRNKQHIKIRVIGLIKVWVTQYSQDFVKNDILTSYLINFLETNGKEVPGAAKAIIDTLKRTTKSTEFVKEGSGEWKIVKKVTSSSPKLRDSTASEIADQLCLIEQAIFQKVEPKEWLVRYNKRTQENCPNLLVLINHFNQISNWVTTQVEKRSSVKKKTKSYNRFLTLSARLSERHNFNGMDEVSVGLRRTSVGQTSQASEQLAIKDYTSLIQTASLPLIPSIGAIELELKFIEDCFPKDLDEGLLLLWTKREKLFEVIEPITEYQKQSYQFQENGDIKKWLSGVGKFQ